MNLLTRNLTAIALLSISGPAFAATMSSDTNADINASPAAIANDVNIQTGTQAAAPVKSNASKMFGVKTSSTLKARAERNHKTDQEKADLERTRQIDMRRSGTTYSTETPASGVDTSGKGTSTSTIGKSTNYGIGSEIGTRAGGGTRR